MSRCSRPPTEAGIGPEKLLLDKSLSKMTINQYQGFSLVLIDKSMLQTYNVSRFMMCPSSTGILPLKWFVERFLDIKQVALTLHVACIQQRLQ